MITLLVVEDDSEYRHYLIDLLEEDADFRILATVGSGEEAVRQAGRLHPDVVLMDIGLPGLSGIEATRRIRLVFPSANILVLTVFDDDERVFEAIKAGARGYLLKGDGARELPHAIREVCAGHSLIQPVVARKVLDEFQRLASSNVRAKSGEALSPREREVLTLLSQGKRLQAAAEHLHISPETVKTYVKRIYEKLEVSSKAEAIVAGIKQGLIDTESPP